MKINKQYKGVLIATFMTIILGTIMSFAMVSINTGWTEGFLERFAHSWITGAVVAFPTSYVAIPLVRRLVNRMVSE
ncbi:MAG: DUF2798 domain-containing protein [Candidatus Bathyarchaeota archaeon]|nr:DUF2798 domain-containing protein [Candidatus Bathyarchaeum sp.]